MKTCVTVDVDERGRFTVPEPARRVLSIKGERSEVDLRVRVLEPTDVKGNTAETENPIPVDERGRATIKPATLRDELGIRGVDAVVEATIETPGDTE